MAAEWWLPDSDNHPFVPFFAAVVASSWLGGRAGGLSATLFSTLLIWFVYIPNQMSFQVASWDTMLSIAVFALTGLGVSYSHDWMRRGVDTVQQANEELSRRDVELRLQASEAIRERERRLFTVVENLSEGLILADLNGHPLHWNPAAVAMHDFEDDIDLGQHLEGYTEIFELLTLQGEVVPFERWPIPRILSGELIRDWRLRLRRVDQSWEKVFRYNGSLIADGNGGKAALLTMSEITERYRAEQEARESQDRLRAVTESLNEGLIMVSPSGQLVQWNRAGLKMHGYESMQVGTRLPDFRTTFVISTLQDEVLPFEQWPLSRILAGETLSGLDLRLQRPDVGLDRFYRYSGSLVADGAGRPIAFLALDDITEEVTAQREVAALNAELERRVDERTTQFETANKELEAFSYSVSHDLRAPLRAMDGYSLALLEDYQELLPEDGQRYLHTIRRSAQRMGQLIDDLLSFSRLSKSALNKRPVQVDSLFKQAFEDLADESVGREVDVTIGEMPPCLADPTLLSQVCINLVSNALKYTQRREKAIIEVGGYQQKGDSIYYIRDNGTGFDMRYADKLFGVFQRLHRAEEFEGTGVGLAIVGRVVERHGGRVWAEASPDQGATFSFSLTGVPAGEP